MVKKFNEFINERIDEKPVRGNTIRSQHKYDRENSRDYKEPSKNNVNRYNQDKYANKMWKKLDGEFDDFDNYDDLNHNDSLEITLEPDNLNNELIDLINNDEMVKMIRWETDDNFMATLKDVITKDLDEDEIYQLDGYTYLRID